MRRVIQSLVFAGAVAAMAVPAAAKDWQKVVIGMDLTYAPWSFTDATGAFMGFEVDVANDLCPRMKVECELTSQAWDTIIPSLEAGKFDVIIAAMAITDERRKKLAFSIPYATSARVLVTQTDTPYTTLPRRGESIDIGANPAAASAAVAALRENLNGAKIGVLTSTAQGKFLQESFRGGAEIRQYTSAEQYLLDLDAGRIDLAFDTVAYLTGIVKGPDGTDLQLVGPELSGGTLGEGFGVAIRQSDPELKALFDTAIAEARADGTLSRLSEKWFGVDISPK